MRAEAAKHMKAPSHQIDGYQEFAYRTYRATWQPKLWIQAPVTLPFPALTAARFAKALHGLIGGKLLAATITISQEPFDDLARLAVAGWRAESLP